MNEIMEESNYTKLLTPKKQKIVTAVFILGIVLAGGIMFAITSIMNNDYNKAKSYYLKNNTSSMKQLYTNMNDVDSDKMFDYLEDNAQSVSGDYIAEKIPYEDASSDMNKIKSFYKVNGVSENFKKLNSNIIELYQSRKSYELAVNAEQNDLYEVAYENYKKVIKTDSNYTAATDKMIILCPVIANQLYILAKEEYELANYPKAFDDICRALGFEQHNEDMIKFKDECVAKKVTQTAEVMIAQVTAQMTAQLTAQMTAEEAAQRIAEITAQITAQIKEGNTRITVSVSPTVWLTIQVQ